MFTGVQRTVVRSVPRASRQLCISRIAHESAAGTNDMSALLQRSKAGKNRRAVYARLKNVMKRELESDFKLKNRTKLQLLDKRTMRLKMRYNPGQDGEFTDFGILKAQADSLRSNVKGVQKPTPSQRKILAALGSRFSCLTRLQQGSGQSLAAMMYILNFRRPDPGSTTALVLVPTEELVKQYQAQCGKILKTYPRDTAQMCQFVYRSTPEEEARQEKALAATVPHMLVSTPQRLLDLISQHPAEPNRWKLDRLRIVVCDEADVLLLKDTGRAELKARRHARPAELLIDYIAKLRQTVVNNPPLQYCFISAVDHTDALPDLIGSKAWCEERPMVQVGVPMVRPDEAVPLLRIPTDVGVRAVVATAEKTFVNVKLNVLPVGLLAAQKIKNPVAREFDANYKGYRFGELSKNGSRILPRDLVESVPDLLRAMGTENRRQLLVIPEGVSAVELKAQLADLKIFITFQQEEDFFKSRVPHLAKGEDPGQFSPSRPQFLCLTANRVIGLNFPGLEDVLCLGLDSVVDHRALINIAGRFNRATGAAGENSSSGEAYFVEQGRSVDESERHGGKRGQITLVYPATHFTYMERFNLERILLKSGLPYLEPAVEGDEDVDLSSYEKLFNEEDI